MTSYGQRVVRKGDSKPHGVTHRFLKPARLPVRHFAGRQGCGRMPRVNCGSQPVWLNPCSNWAVKITAPARHEAPKEPVEAPSQKGTRIQTSAILKVMVTVFLVCGFTLAPTLLLAPSRPIAMTISAGTRLEGLGFPNDWRRRDLPPRPRRHRAVCLLRASADRSQATALYERLPELRAQIGRSSREPSCPRDTRRTASGAPHLPRSPLVPPRAMGRTAVERRSLRAGPGPRLYLWSRQAHLRLASRLRPARHRPKMARRRRSLRVVVAYMQAQLRLPPAAVSALSFLSLLHVPAAFPLALLAAVCDAIPVLGVLLAIGPAASRHDRVAGSGGDRRRRYLLYHAFENYVLIPGSRQPSRRRRSPFWPRVLVGAAYGVVGAILFIPIAAPTRSSKRSGFGHVERRNGRDHAILEQTDAAGATTPSRRW